MSIAARLIIAEDHAMVRAGLRRIVELAPGLRVVAEAASGAGTLARIADTPCDLLLADWTMPPPSGIELLRALKARAPGLPVLVVTMHAEPRIARAALEEGAAGYITKGSEPDELLHAVQRVLSGDRYVEGRLLQEVAFAVLRPQRRLSPRQAQVLHGLARGDSPRQIAAALFISAKTVSSHKSNLMEKFDLRTNAEVIRFGLQHLRESGQA